MCGRGRRGSCRSRHDGQGRPDRSERVTRGQMRMITFIDLGAGARRRMQLALVAFVTAGGCAVAAQDKAPSAVRERRVAAAAGSSQPSTSPPPLIASPADLKARIPRQLHITKPDFVVFVPEVTDAGVHDTGNEHFLVFDGPDGSLMAVWTQSSAEAQPDQHIAFARSGDEGVTWSKPRVIAGPRKPGDGHMASWAYPLVSRTCESPGSWPTRRRCRCRFRGIPPSAPARNRRS